MKYNIKAIPTKYAGVTFRSRLEARWAAFFDLCDWRWEYEPFDLNGWAPDFLVKMERTTVLVEVKPFDLSQVDWANRQDVSAVRDAYLKTQNHWRDHPIVILGSSPILTHNIVGMFFEIPENAKCSFDDLISDLQMGNANKIWREAGNATQWNPPHKSDVDFVRASAAKANA